MPEIIIAVQNKLPILAGAVQHIVADNSDYTIRFLFDDQWEEGEKTVYFVRSNGYAYPPVKTVDGVVNVPVQTDVNLISQLLIGVRQGEVKTSRPCGIAVYPAISNIIKDDAVQPKESLWEMVLDRLDELEKNGGGGGVDSDEVKKIVNEALEEAKESGKFKGESGVYVGSAETMPEGTKVRIDPSGRKVKIPEIDLTLTQEGFAADAAAVGREVKQLSKEKADKVIHLTTEQESAALGEELISADGWTSDGWTGDFATGFTHTSGNTNPLIFAMPEATGENVYLVSFVSSVELVDTNLAVTIGGSAPFSLYGQGSPNATVFVGIKSVSDGNLEFVPESTFNGTLTEISIKPITGEVAPIQKIVDSNGQGTYELRTSNGEKDNIFIGNTSGRQNYSGVGNVALGTSALQNNTSGFWNTAIGTDALKLNTVGSRNVAIGRIALKENISGKRNIAIGTFALNHNKTGGKNIAIGADALDKNETGGKNIAIGAHALYVNNADSNIAIGEYSMVNNTSGTFNVAMGSTALDLNTTGSYNMAIGAKALFKNTTKSNNIAIGYCALYGAGGEENIAIGANAGKGTGNYNKCTLIGAHAGQSMTDGADANTFIGRNAGGSVTKASYNTFIGSGAGTNHTAGYNNILIGQSTQTPTPTTSNYLNIGNIITGSSASADKYVKINGGLDLSEVPTTDPAIAGRVWNDNGTLKISTGVAV